MKKYEIPTAKFEVFTDAQKAREYVKVQGAPIVIKADGLAAGKGVIVAATLQEALEAVDSIMCDHTFGDAGSRVVIEECLVGEAALPTLDYCRDWQNDYSNDFFTRS